MEVDDEDLFPPDNLIVLPVIRLVRHDQVEEHPAVVQQQAEHEEEPPDTETPRAWLRLEVLLDVAEGRFDAPALPVQLAHAERRRFLPAWADAVGFEAARLHVEARDERLVHDLLRILSVLFVVLVRGDVAGKRRLNAAIIRFVALFFLLLLALLALLGDRLRLTLQRQQRRAMRLVTRTFDFVGSVVGAALGILLQERLHPTAGLPFLDDVVRADLEDVRTDFSRAELRVRVDVPDVHEVAGAVEQVPNALNAFVALHLRH